MDIPIDPNTLNGLIAFALGTYTAKEVRKPIAKLILTARDFIGWSFEPQRIRAMAEAEADARIIEAKADQAVQKIKAEGRLELHDIRARAAQRITITQDRQQRNLESIVLQASQSLPGDVSDTSVDPDWTAQFFEGCQNVSNEQLRQIWAKLLAGEVAAPGSFSLKTLSIVRVMSREHADLFTRLGKTVWTTINGTNPILMGTSVPACDASPGLSFEEILKLSALGLITLSGPSGFAVNLESLELIPWTYFDRLHVIVQAPVEKMAVGNALFTEAGRELFPICGAVPSELYRRQVVEWLRADGWSVNEDVRKKPQ